MNTYSGGIYLDSSLSISATAAGGTLSLIGTVDVKAQTLTFGGAGVVNAASALQSSVSGGGLVINGSDALANGGLYTFGGQTFEAQYTTTDFSLVAKSRALDQDKKNQCYQPFSRDFMAPRPTRRSANNVARSPGRRVRRATGRCPCTLRSSGSRTNSHWLKNRIIYFS